MEFHVITLFPEMFESPFRGGMIGRAVEQGLLAIKTHPLRDHGLGNYRQVDDAPYGGGSGMVMRPEPIAAAIDAVDVKETQGDTASVLELRVAKEDLGRVIGKQGRTAKSIRTILNAVASRTNRKVVLEIVEDR